MIHAAEQKRPDVVQKREEWKKFLEETDATKLVFLDESGVNIGLTRNYGRSRGKERVKDSVPFNRPVRTTIVSGIRLSGRAFQRICGEDFVSCVETRRHRSHGQSFSSQSSRNKRTYRGRRSRSQIFTALQS